MVIPGDVVRYRDQDMVVVDVTFDVPAVAILRAEDDLELWHPVAAPAVSLRVVGHIAPYGNWTEDSPGIWKQA